MVSAARKAKKSNRITGRTIKSLVRVVNYLGAAELPPNLLTAANAAQTAATDLQTALKSYINPT